MKQERTTRLAARGGVLLSAALWLLIAVAAVQASPTVAPVNIDPPTITGTARVGEALMGLRRVCPDVRFLGSYPRADADTEDASAEKDDAVYRDAAAWLGRIRSGRV